MCVGEEFVMVFWRRDCSERQTGYVSGKRKAISTVLGQQQEPGEVLGCGTRKEQKKQRGVGSTA